MQPTARLTSWRYSNRASNCKHVFFNHCGEHQLSTSKAKWNATRVYLSNCHPNFINQHITPEKFPFLTEIFLDSHTTDWGLFKAFSNAIFYVSLGYKNKIKELEPYNTKLLDYEKINNLLWMSSVDVTKE